MKPATIIGSAALFLAAIQLVPYGKNHTNPPITGEPAWDAPQTRELFFKTCRDCHSNETFWPWYSHIAPLSWLTQLDVSLGRAKFNVSEWGREGKNEGEDAAGEVREGTMPPWFYLPAHPEAKLTDADASALADGLEATFGKKKHKE